MKLHPIIVIRIAIIKHVNDTKRIRSTRMWEIIHLKWPGKIYEHLYLIRSRFTLMFGYIRHTLTYCTSSHIHIFIHTYSCHNRFITPHTKPLNINSFRIVFENVAKIKTLLPIFMFSESDSESKSESENENERLEPNLKMSMKILFKHML